ncbi:hypothetical protein DXG01_008844 [Tephrocybe rancida]|nr:hypothetical protein DXG01_008844 [Tephrocybe rancida]
MAFSLDDASNLSMLDPSIHLHLDSDIITIIVTPTAPTLRGLITLVQKANANSQKRCEQTTLRTITKLKRVLQFQTSDAFKAPTYELLIIEPNRFLPNSQPLIVRDRSKGAAKSDALEFVIASDNELRETHSHRSPKFPPFETPSDYRKGADQVNPFLVAINASWKFSHLQKHTPNRLSQHAQTLAILTAELFEEIYKTNATVPEKQIQSRDRRSTVPRNYADENEDGDDEDMADLDSDNDLNSPWASAILDDDMLVDVAWS